MNCLKYITTDKAKGLLKETTPSGSISNEQCNFILNNEFNKFINIKDDFDPIAEERVEKLVGSPRTVPKSDLRA